MFSHDALNPFTTLGDKMVTDTLGDYSYHCPLIYLRLNVSFITNPHVLEPSWMFSPHDVSLKEAAIFNVSVTDNELIS